MPKGIPRNSSTKAQALKRLKVARGHLNKVIQMVEDDDYCIDVVHQSLAVSAALKKTNELILENHLKTCVADSIKMGDEHMIIEEVMAVLKKS
jgi:DNA-binding FrmR family transcriptional regulator